MYVIPITTRTINLIEVLNNGVRPELEGANTYFIWHKERPAEIWTEDRLLEEPGDWTAINTFAKK